MKSNAFMKVLRRFLIGVFLLSTYTANAMLFVNCLDIFMKTANTAAENLESGIAEECNPPVWRCTEEHFAYYHETIVVAAAYYENCCDAGGAGCP